MSHRVVDIFKEISKIPRCSKHCSEIANWICSWAENNGFKCTRDNYGNVIVNVPPTPKFERKPPLALQGHMDMVCVKDERVEHDFLKDPIEVFEDGGWLKAEGTTLGADDGVALAIGMALAEDERREHPELELVFTADEEIGLVGAMNLNDDFVKSKRLINIDTEKEGVFIIGCAGGEDIDLFFDIKRFPRKFSKAYGIYVSGLKGGHSGIDINRNRANAIKLLNEVLYRAFGSVELVDFKGGKARNAIPDFASAVVFTDSPDELIEVASKVENYAKALFTGEDEICIEIKETITSMDVVDRESFRKIVDLINKLPHGVYEMYDEETPKISNNLATVDISVNEFKLSSNQRSLAEEGLNKIGSVIEGIANEFSCGIKKHSKYPSWSPNPNSSLLREAKTVYKDMFGVEPQVKVIHAGLECGIFTSKLRDIEMISIGPNMKDIHSPKEKLEIASFIRTYEFICELIKR